MARGSCRSRWKNLARLARDLTAGERRIARKAPVRDIPPALIGNVRVDNQSVSKVECRYLFNHAVDSRSIFSTVPVFFLTLRSRKSDAAPWFLTRAAPLDGRRGERHPSAVSLIKSIAFYGASALTQYAKRPRRVPRVPPRARKERASERRGKGAG